MIIKWIRQRRDEAIHRKYHRLNLALAEQGSDSRWQEVVKGEWYCISTVHLEKPYPPIRDIRKINISVPSVTTTLFCPKVDGVICPHFDG